MVNPICLALNTFWGDIFRRFKFGGSAPVKYQRVFVSPSSIKLATRYFIKATPTVLISGGDLCHSAFLDKRRQFIVGGDWDKQVVPIDDVSIIARAKKHFFDRYSWEATGEIDWLESRADKLGSQDGCKDRVEIHNRLVTIDQMARVLKREKRLKTQGELRRFPFREKGGVGVGIDRLGNIVWIADGAHRLALAQGLGFDSIPVCLLIVHEEAVKNGIYDRNFVSL